MSGTDTAQWVAIIALYVVVLILATWLDVLRERDRRRP